MITPEPDPDLERWEPKRSKGRWDMGSGVSWHTEGIHRAFIGHSLGHSLGQEKFWKMSYPTLPYPTLPYPTLRYATLPYPTPPYATLPYDSWPTGCDCVYNAYSVYHRAHWKRNTAMCDIILRMCIGGIHLIKPHSFAVNSLVFGASCAIEGCLRRSAYRRKKT